MSHLVPVWLIFGGQSPEHDISISSARTAAQHLNKERYAVRPVYIRRDGDWAVAEELLNPADDVAAVIADLTQREGMNPGAAMAKAHDEAVAAALLILHGACGEDGTIQGMLEMNRIQYTGSGVLASSLSMDKVRCQQFLRGYGMPVADSVHNEDAQQNAAALTEQALQRIGLPCVVKPSRAGSSVGISIVKEEQKLLPAIQQAAQIDRIVMVEKFVAGRELTCGVIEQWNDGRCERRAMPVTEIRPKNSEFFDFKAKYTAGESEEITPAPIDAETTALVQQLAQKAFGAVGCRDMARVDFILSPESGPHILEINTIPGLTPTSLLPQQASHVGISFGQLLEIFVENAIARSTRMPQAD